jgi:hypothetical protein
VPSQVLTEDARLLRFLTPTEAWKGRVASRVSLPGEWPLMLVEIFHREDGQISTICALGGAQEQSQGWGLFPTAARVTVPVRHQPLARTGPLHNRVGPNGYYQRRS